ncbi:uncharacterized protein [Pseudorasbora parva]|uniref:uncharacterized protein n=1 Tax=Pseudorasbora parva TaxID=51549 RepID=UPI00351E9CF6
MKSTLETFPFLFLMCGVIGKDEDRLKSVSVMEGDSVTLNPDSTQIQGIILIQWRFGVSVIAETNANEISYPHLSEIFGGRLQLDHQTGSLTINNMRIKHSGFYQLEINHNTGSSHMELSVTVYDSPPVIDFERKIIMWGDPVTLQTDMTETHGDELIVWRFGDEGKLIAKSDIEAKSSTLYETEERFRDRLKLDYQTGSLTITHTRTTDSEIYTVKISSSSSKQTIFKRFNVTIRAVPDPGPGLPPGAIAGIIVVLLLVSAAAVYVFLYCQLNERQAEMILTLCRCRC